MPGGQAVQVATAEAPVVLLAVPGGQPVHWAWPRLLLYVPAGHAMHVAVWHPRSRESQCIETNSGQGWENAQVPGTFVYVPMGQARHCVSSVALLERGSSVSMRAKAATTRTYPSVWE